MTIDDHLQTYVDLLESDYLLNSEKGSRPFIVHCFIDKHFHNIQTLPLCPQQDRRCQLKNLLPVLTRPDTESTFFEVFVYNPQILPIEIYGESKLI